MVKIKILSRKIIRRLNNYFNEALFILFFWLDRVCFSASRKGRQLH